MVWYGQASLVVWEPAAAPVSDPGRLALPPVSTRPYLLENVSYHGSGPPEEPSGVQNLISEGPAVRKGADTSHQLFLCQRFGDENNGCHTFG